MDPLAHTLVGAALARSRLGTRVVDGDAANASAGVLATGMMAANVADLDVLAYLAGGDAALGFRRGLTHGPLGFLVLPGLVVAALWLWRRARSHEGGAVSWSRLLLLSYGAALTHPLLDLSNTYGVRLLMPFDDRWFYGDVLFIVDPWFWLILGSGLFLSSAAGPRSNALWAAALIVVSAPVLLAPVPADARLLWLGVLGMVILYRRLRGARLRRRPSLVVEGALVLWLLYVGAAVAEARSARAEVAQRLAQRGIRDVERLMVGPLPARFGIHEVVFATAEEIRVGAYSRFLEPRLELSEQRYPRPDLDDPRVRAALADPSIRGLVGWARFPSVELVREGGEEVAYVVDVRYLRGRPAGLRSFGGARLVLGPSRREASEEP